MRPEIEQQVRAALPSLRLFWSFMLAASLTWAGLGVFASPVASPAATAATAPLAASIAVLGLVCAGATLWLDRVLLAPGRIAKRIPIPDYALAQRHLLAGHLVLWSLAELPSLLGFAQLFLDGTLGTHLALCAVSLAILALLMPTRSRIGTRLAAVLR